MSVGLAPVRTLSSHLLSKSTCYLMYIFIIIHDQKDRGFQDSLRSLQSYQSGKQGKEAEQTGTRNNKILSNLHISTD